MLLPSGGSAVQHLHRASTALLRRNYFTTKTLVYRWIIQLLFLSNFHLMKKHRIEKWRCLMSNMSARHQGSNSCFLSCKMPSSCLQCLQCSFVERSIIALSSMLPTTWKWLRRHPHSTENFFKMVDQVPTRSEFAYVCFYFLT